MNRRNKGLLALGVVALVAATGCGGKSSDDLFVRQHAGLAPFHGQELTPMYFGMTNTIELSGPGGGSFELMAGAQFELEVATTDSSPLVFELHRERNDGTSELVAPVDATSGFYLSHFEASSNGRFVVWFPEGKKGQAAVVHLACDGGDGRCATTRQPNESCGPGFACDRGLDCTLPEGHCDAYLELGRCTFRPAVCTDASDVTCGCDGKTYASACAARAAGTGISHAGSCSPEVTAPR